MAIDYYRLKMANFTEQVTSMMAMTNYTTASIDDNDVTTVAFTDVMSTLWSMSEVTTGTGTLAGNTTTSAPTMFIRTYAVIAKINSILVKKYFVPALIYTFTMMFIGAPGNALVFYVYLWKWRKSTARIFILALAIFDMINCFLTVPMEITFTFRLIILDIPLLCKMSRFITFWMNNCSSFTLVGIVIDRYWRICRPLQPQMTTHQAKRIVFAAILLGFACSWPALVVYGTQTLPIPISKNLIVVGKSCIVEDKFLTDDMKVYPLAFTSVLLIGNVAIDIFFVIAYVLIGVQVLKHGQFSKEYAKQQNWRKGSTSSSTEDDDDNRNQPGGSLLSRLSKLSNGNGSKSSGSGKSRKHSHQKIDTLELKDKRAMFAKQRSVSVGSQSKTAAERRMRAQRTTFMLSMVTLLFVLSFIPYCVLVIIRYVRPNFYFTLSDSSKSVYQVFFRSYLLSSAVQKRIF
ncbi:hypothetical protein KUTeg_014523 [Tegillarca granosa]|uniref:G-protein coupled receptors family 1 profile domain-containing protein n=1 Tax=Tegillarca granosa TaxID=220873 RepID=A0ABQ9ERT5_TEGGR|nr:hypothetical protein KUTeg_014523 [Tegillarca granosa]